jgi:hypothetical protein
MAQQSAVSECERRQQSNATTRQEAPPQQVDGGMRMMNNALWIPEHAVELQLRLCVEAHCRSAGHRACEATLGAIKEYVAWTTMAKDFVIELSRRDSPKWHMRLAVYHVNCLPKALFLVLFCVLYFLHLRWVFA